MRNEMDGWMEKRIMELNKGQGRIKNGELLTLQLQST